MAKIKIPRDEMLDILDGKDVVRDRITGNGRWNINHELIFRRGEQLLRTTYRVGATESQDETPFQYDAEVECTEVRAVQVTVTEYEAVT